jgi:DNA helicase-4
MDFEDFWGTSELSRIETTYRFSQSLIDISSNFVMKNPRQIKKSIRSGISDTSFAVSKIEGYKPNSAIQFMTDRLMYLPKNSSVFLIGRYTFDIKMLETDSRLSVRFDTATQTQKIKLQNRPDLSITFYTAHKSKGLQADYVYIINNLNKTLGFPSKVENNPLINLLLERGDSYAYAEERRLFYVALTRAKKHVYLVTIRNRESDFEQELENDYGTRLLNETYICPQCRGKLRVIEGKYGKFFGCENYREDGHRFSAKIPD